jgi:hypothetical protein
VHNAALKTVQSSPFISVPVSEIWRNRNLSLEAKATWVSLRGYVWSDDKPCWASEETLANELGRSVTSIRSYLHELVDAGLVTIQARKGQTNLYYLTSPPRLASGPAPCPTTHLPLNLCATTPSDSAHKVDIKNKIQRTTTSTTRCLAAVPSPSAQEPEPVSPPPAAAPPPLDPAPQSPDPEAFKALHAEHIATKKATELATKHPERVAPQIAALKWRRNVHNRPGYLIRAIEFDWPLPSAMIRQQKQATAKAEAARQEADAKVQAIEQLQAEQEKAKETAITLAALPPERQEELEIHARQWALIQCAKFGREDGGSSYLRWFSGARETLLAGQPLDED